MSMSASIVRLLQVKASDADNNFAKQFVNNMGKFTNYKHYLDPKDDATATEIAGEQQTDPDDVEDYDYTAIETTMGQQTDPYNYTTATEITEKQQTDPDEPKDYDDTAIETTMGQQTDPYNYTTATEITEYPPTDPYEPKDTAVISERAKELCASKAAVNTKTNKSIQLKNASPTVKRAFAAYAKQV